MDRYLEEEDCLSVVATKSCAAGAGMTLGFCGMTSSCQHHVRTQRSRESWEQELHLEGQASHAHVEGIVVLDGLLPLCNHRNCRAAGPHRHPLAFRPFPRCRDYRAYLAPPLSRRDEEGFSSCSTRPCHRAVALTPPEWSPRRSGCGFGFPPPCHPATRTSKDRTSSRAPHNAGQ